MKAAISSLTLSPLLSKSSGDSRIHDFDWSPVDGTTRRLEQRRCAGRREATNQYTYEAQWKSKEIRPSAELIQRSLTFC
jgi:hypothetical protein